MYTYRIINISAILIVIVCIAFFSPRCSQVETGGIAIKAASTEFQNIVTADSMVVSWDPPDVQKDSILNYELEYKSSRQSSWTVIKSAIPAADSPHVVVHRNEVDPSDSIFLFAVRTVAKTGLKSDFHASTEANAEPPNWYVLWK
jgi:hypothetical protein